MTSFTYITGIDCFSGITISYFCKYLNCGGTYSFFPVVFKKFYACYRSNRRDCTRYEFRLHSSLELVEKVYIWFHKRRIYEPLNFSAYFQNTTDVHHYNESTSDIEMQLQWIRFPLKRYSMEYFNGTLQCSIEVTGVYELDVGKLPVMVVNRKIQKTNRIKRDNSIKSEEGTKCQDVDRYISFSEINWDNWVLQPAVLNIRACSGTCTYVQSTANISYGSLVYSYEKYHPMPEDDACSKFWVPHCYPNKMASVRILYVDSDTKSPVLTDVKDMVVVSCSLCPHFFTR
ncbi:TGF_BETA_2 domain-containing protein [Caerostris extrusa]|uniref:TGF_BETA_2 domain-containing protein n=1 Tax=Caerostris extrusa TaxID=172846 RepID=A0AAV4Q1G7_CAEEX|nr:TGF_BETA_2 domain-containing protein [Caerostris extrusa]